MEAAAASLVVQGTVQKSPSGGGTLEVQGAGSPALQQETRRSEAHKRFPRWFRMATRVSVLVGLVALPSLVVKDEDFKGLNKYRNFNVLFTTLGTTVLPVWIPHLGSVVVAFTLLVPLGVSGLWIAYGLFLACSNIVFMMLACVVVTALTFFTSELLGLPVGLMSVFALIFVAGANSFVQTPPMAHTMSCALSILLVFAALVATWVCALIFPEYCVDEVFRHHHEGLEHLLHLAYYALGLKPPRLLRRVASSSAQAVGRTSGWKAAFAAADELPTSLQALDRIGSLAREESLAPGSGGSEHMAGAGKAAGGGIRFAEKVERSWHRVAAAFMAGGKAQVGAKAEVVLAAKHHKRIILPCVPLIPCSKGQLDEPALLALRHVGLATALHIIQVFNATQALEPAMEQLLKQLLSVQEWAAMRSALLGALQELVDVFPQDYYPAAAPPDTAHLRALQASIAALQAAWEQQKLSVQLAAAPAPAQQQQQQQAAVDPHAAVTVLPAVGAAAAAFADPLVPDGSPAASVLARLRAVHLVKLLEELLELLEQLYDVARRASANLVSCRLGCA